VGDTNCSVPAGELEGVGEVEVDALGRTGQFEEALAIASSRLEALGEKLVRFDAHVARSE